jgi:NhaP-type Na+/H+ or K+/H+ antiporter
MPFWGFTTICLFWAAMIRATREWGGTFFQGRAFGWLEGGRGGVAALLATLSFLLFSQIRSFQWVILATSAFTLLSGILVWLFIPLQFRRADPSEKARAHQGYFLPPPQKKHLAADHHHFMCILGLQDHG